MVLGTRLKEGRQRPPKANKSGWRIIEHGSRRRYWKEEIGLKRTRRIEVIRFERRVTWSNENNPPYPSEGHEIDVLLEALGNIAPAPEELRDETDQGGGPSDKSGR
jgi:hypothetical protein